MSVPALRWPLSVGPDGRFALSATREDAWGRRVLAVVSTRLGERVMRADYGCGAADALFDTVDAQAMSQSIRQALNTWTPALEITNIRVAAAGAQVDVEVDYRLPGGTEQSVATAFRTPVGGSA